MTNSSNAINHIAPITSSALIKSPLSITLLYRSISLWVKASEQPKPNTLVKVMASFNVFSLTRCLPLLGGPLQGHGYVL